MQREPVFNAPSSIVGCLAVLVVAHVVIWHLLTDAATDQVVQLMAFVPARFGPGAATVTGGWPAAIWSLVTHQLVHGDIMHLVVNCASLLIFGSAIAARVGGQRCLLLGVLSGVVGALVFLISRFGEPVPMIGASGAASGLMGAAFRFFFAALDHGGFQMFRLAPKAIPLMTIKETLGDRRFQLTAATLAVFNLLFAIAPSIAGADGIAWQAHLGGFLFGLLTFDAFEPKRPRRPDLKIVRPTLH